MAPASEMVVAETERAEEVVVEIQTEKPEESVVPMDEAKADKDATSKLLPIGKVAALAAFILQPTEPATGTTYKGDRRKDIGKRLLRRRCLYLVCFQPNK